MTYRESIDWLFSTQMFGIKLGLEGPKRLLREYLAYPPHGTKVIHVAGTNGKGSTCAMIDSIARAAGWRSGLFTSPHLIDFSERIRVSGVAIPEPACATMLTELRAICERLDPHPTFFEITLTLGMRWFREQGCDLIVLETGMGGRLDATTAVPADVCVITPIGLDHMQWLGDTIEAIALEKAGIMVEGKPVICSPQEADAMEVLEKEANARRAPLHRIEAPLLGYSIPLAGQHQRWNAALAASALHHARIPINSDILRHGLAQLEWPGRFERIDDRIILDGAHNPHGARMLHETWKTEYPSTKASLVFSAVSDKDSSGILAELCPLAVRILLCPIDNPRACPVDALAASLPDPAPPHQTHTSFTAALEDALNYPEPILVTGSLFLIGEARAHLTGGRLQSSSQ